MGSYGGSLDSCRDGTSGDDHRHVKRTPDQVGRTTSVTFVVIHYGLSGSHQGGSDDDKEYGTYDESPGP